ncbi:uncharacterized protein LOC112683231 [Sipha flava]|uniref:Uncharacterized protein LOC112683231 n=1 Tax=Sipha flava TaxID=143950 RepID=A0A8B8FGS5_9HEMI|nr:uncharacterized protein LOC112683231 [Sipha flava]
MAQGIDSNGLENRDNLSNIQKRDTGVISNYRGISLKEKSTTDHIFTIRRVMEKFYEYNKDLHILFVDFKQAYDSIDREQLWITLRIVNIQRKLVKLVEICNQQTYCKLRLMRETSEAFECKTGLRQRNALSPVLFNLALEQVIMDMHEKREMEFVCYEYSSSIYR